MSYGILKFLKQQTFGIKNIPKEKKQYTTNFLG